MAGEDVCAQLLASQVAKLHVAAVTIFILGDRDKDQKRMHRDNSCSAASSQSMPTLQKINYIKVYIQFNRKIIWMVLQDGIIVYSGKLKEIYVCSS